MYHQKIQKIHHYNDFTKWHWRMWKPNTSGNYCICLWMPLLDCLLRNWWSTPLLTYFFLFLSKEACALFHRTIGTYSKRSICVVIIEINSYHIKNTWIELYNYNLHSCSFISIVTLFYYSIYIIFSITFIFHVFDNCH